MDSPDFGVFIFALAWSLLSLCDVTLKAIHFAMVFPTEADFKTICQLYTFQFADGLWQIFHAASPPTIEFLKTLPMPDLCQKIWGVYVLVLEKPGANARVYTSTGTDSVLGYQRRHNDYTRFRRTRKRDSTMTNRILRSVLEDGFEITHQGLVCWCPLPQSAHQFPMRCLFLLLETVFSLAFWTMTSKKKDWCMPALCPWDRKQFTYDGLCTHFAINEGVFGAAEWEASKHLDPMTVNTLRTERKKAKNRQYIANKGEGVHKARCAKTRAKALKEHRYKCVPCNKTFPCEAKLKTHEKGLGHKNKIKYGGSRSRASQRAKNWCEVCKWGAPSAKRLATHLKSVVHAKNLRVNAGPSA
jgi:5-methylcytosine-specific restriction endonuclease McrA